ncbi:DEAD/DEAH box helicase domain-containing protein [Phthorimaea operculella]|nr:DEAD/DEAH box helicase domain-containing protein [Phthorimaea operculella]
MFSKYKSARENTSTPKRRRLGTGRILRPNLQVFTQGTNVLQSPNGRPDSPFDQNDDPPLPCNQVEYLCDSGNTSSTSSDIPCSPGVLECSIMNNKWESLVVSRDLTTIINKAQESVKELDQIEDISDEMFYSKLEQESSRCDHGNNSLLTSRCEKHFRENIEESFDMINQSINDLFDKSNKKDDRSSLFETKDSFLLDIKESGIVIENQNNVQIGSKPNIVCNNINYQNGFYGLPMETKSLFKLYRNIEKFYDWQEECLNLPAIRDRRNLIYALPTSGGKTLVAEVLMLREVLCRKKNALFILPFVAIVQEKIWSLSPFAVKLDFLVEEYAAGKGHIPPKKRRNKNSIFVATIEKGLALVRSLIEENRLDELGLVVVDELHLIGEPGRGATLETLLSTILFSNKNIQIVGMSATIGNLPELASFLKAEVFQREFRPVELTEYVKLGDMLHKVVWSEQGMEVVPHRQLAFDYTTAGASLDPDRLGGLVSEVVPGGSCLVFCPTKRNCENVATLLCKLQRREMVTHKSEERHSLAEALRAEGSGIDLQRVVRCGIAYHHAGLSGDERSLLEHAFRSGAISVLCCTSTLAAGVNLPAQRVIIRAPKVGRDFISLGSYKQMVGRAGRAGVCDNGKQECDNGKLECDNGKLECDSGKQECDNGKQECDNGKQECDNGKQECDHGKQECDNGKQECDNGKQECDHGKQECDNGKQEG